MCGHFNWADGGGGDDGDDDDDDEEEEEHEDEDAEEEEEDADDDDSPVDLPLLEKSGLVVNKWGIPLSWLW